MNAAGAKFAAAAANSANMLSANYKRASASLEAMPNGGVRSRLVREARSSPPDLVSDMVDQVGAIYSFRANLLVLKVADKMAGRLLNLRA